MRTGRFFAVMIIGWVMLSSISFGASGWIAGKSGNALAFDGVNDYVEVTGYQGVVGTQSRTCCAWIKTAGTQQGVILSWGGDGNGEKWIFRVESNGTLAVGVGGGYVYTTATVNDSQWHHVAAVLNDDGSPSVDEIRLYIDGVLRSTGASSTQSINTLVSYDAAMGVYRSAGNPAGYYNGLLDEVCIYGRALEASEINPQGPISTDGLAAHWAMDEAQGSIAHESVSSYHGLLKNIPEASSGWTTGKTGNALSFDGVNDYVDVAGYKGIVGTQSRTCCAWIKTDAVQQGNIISWGAEQNGQRWSFRTESDGTLGVGVYGGIINTTATVNDGQWHYVAAVLNDDGSPSVDEILFYIDGVLQTATANSTQSIATSAWQNVMLGAFKTAGVPMSYFSGLLDEVCIYDRALEAGEIDPEGPIPTEGLAARWAMDEGEGAIVHDSAASYDGILRYIYGGYPGGTGLPEDPFQITSKEDLLNMAADTAIYDMCFILTADIDMGGQDYLTAIIAPDNDDIKPGYQGASFKGTFNGNGYAISNFTIKRNYYKYSYLGLFGYMGPGGQVKNLKLNNFTIYDGCDYVGGIAGYVSGGTIENCHATGKLAGGKYAGGLAGCLKEGLISNCSFWGTNAQSSVVGILVGGIAGYQYSGVIENSFSQSNVTYYQSSYYANNSRKECIGGLVGLQRDGIIRDCYSKGSVSEVYDTIPVGGIVGEQCRGAVVCCYSTAAIGSSYSNAGGLVGKGYSNQVVRSFWDTQTSGKTVSAGGMGRITEQLKQSANYIGWNGDESVWVLDEGNDYPHLAWENTTGIYLANGTLQGILEGTGTAQYPYLIDDANDLNRIGLYPFEWGKCFSLTQDIDMSGITGTNFNRIGLNSATPFNGTFLGNHHIIHNLRYITTGQEDTVGLFGYIGGTAVIENLGLENANISSKGNQLGSLAGVQDGGLITNCYSINGHVTGGYESTHVGGLAGVQRNGTITQSYSSGVILGGEHIRWTGGLTGLSKGQISDSFSTCTVTGSGQSHFVGGFAGEVSGKVTNCYACGIVTVGRYSNSIGGFAGRSSAVISNCRSNGSVLSGAYTVFVGGFAGLQEEGRIRDCYSINSVGGNDYVGGFIGEQDAGSVINCYTASSIDVPDNAEIAGGFASVSLGAVVNSFWDVEASEISYSSGARGRTTAQMKEAANYIAWNEPNQTIWTLNEANDYPRLAWENLAGTDLPAQAIGDYFTNGTGTPQDPYRITTAQQLNIIGLFPDQWDKAFRFDADIDMSDIDSLDYNRIGLSSLPFTGMIDGNGHVIRNFSFKSMGIESCVGVFGYISGDAIINNLGLENAAIASAGVYVGSLCGRQDSGAISNCYSDGLIIGDYIAGGLIGNQDGDGICRNSFSTTHVIGNDLSDRLGGLVGQQDNGIITDCFASGRVFGADNVGGLVGCQRGSTCVVENSYSTGIVAGTGPNTGGLIGFRKGSVNSSFWDTQTSMKSTSAGGTGKNTMEMKSLSTFNNAGWDFTNSDGDPEEWTMPGEGDYPHMTWKPEIPKSVKQDGMPYNGGTGLSDDPFQINDIVDIAEMTKTPSHWSKSFKLTDDINLDDITFSQALISPQQSPGYVIDTSLFYYDRPFYGTIFTGTFDGQGHVIRNMTIANAKWGYEGLFGRINNSRITNLGVEDCFIYNSFGCSGAFVGYLENSIISQCYSTGSLNGSNFYSCLAGGLAGYFRSGIIGNSYSQCSLDKVSYAGGLVGAIKGGMVMNCYSTGYVNGSSNIGGLVGYTYGGGAFGSFWDTQSSGRETSAGGTGKTTEEMQRRAFYTNLGWATGSKNNGLMLDGIDDYVEVPGYKGIVGAQSRTCCAWIKTTTAQQGNIISWGAEQNGQRWSFRVESNGTLGVGVYGGVIDTTVTVNDGQWHYVAAVLNDDGSPSVDEIQIYIDGAVRATTATSSQSINTAASQNVMLGAFQTAGVSSSYYIGLLDEVCVYDRALNASEISPDGPTAMEGLVANWAMDETEGLVVHDTVSSFDGIIKNFGAGWDFTNETVNGTQNYWRICADGVDYPRLNWESVDGDFQCPDGVSTEDLDYFIGKWLLNNCTADNNYCGGVDGDGSGSVDLGDWAVLAGHWLEGI